MFLVLALKYKGECVMESRAQMCGPFKSVRQYHTEARGTPVPMRTAAQLSAAGSCRAKSGLLTWTLLNPPGQSPEARPGPRAQASGPAFVLSSAVLI